MLLAVLVVCSLAELTCSSPLREGSTDQLSALDLFKNVDQIQPDTFLLDDQTAPLEVSGSSKIVVQSGGTVSTVEKTFTSTKNTEETVLKVVEENNEDRAEHKVKVVNVETFSGHEESSNTFGENKEKAQSAEEAAQRADQEGEIEQVAGLVNKEGGQISADKEKNLPASVDAAAEQENQGETKQDKENSYTLIKTKPIDPKDVKKRFKHHFRNKFSAFKKKVGKKESENRNIFKKTINESYKKREEKYQDAVSKYVKVVNSKVSKVKENKNSKLNSIIRKKVDVAFKNNIKEELLTNLQSLEKDETKQVTKLDKHLFKSLDSLIEKYLNFEKRRFQKTLKKESRQKVTDFKRTSYTHLEKQLTLFITLIQTKFQTILVTPIEKYLTRQTDESQQALDQDTEMTEIELKASLNKLVFSASFDAQIANADNLENLVDLYFQKKFGQLSKQFEKEMIKRVESFESNIIDVMKDRFNSLETYVHDCLAKVLKSDPKGSKASGNDADTSKMEAEDKKSQPAEGGNADDKKVTDTGNNAKENDKVETSGQRDNEKNPLDASQNVDEKEKQNNKPAETNSGQNDENPFDKGSNEEKPNGESQREIGSSGNPDNVNKEKGDKTVDQASTNNEVTGTETQPPNGKETGDNDSNNKGNGKITDQKAENDDKQSNTGEAPFDRESRIKKIQAAVQKNLEMQARSDSPSERLRLMKEAQALMAMQHDSPVYDNLRRQILAETDREKLELQEELLRKYSDGTVGGGNHIEDEVPAGDDVSLPDNNNGGSSSVGNGRTMRVYDNLAKQILANGNERKQELQEDLLHMVNSGVETEEVEVVENIPELISKNLAEQASATTNEEKQRLMIELQALMARQG